MAEGTQKNTYPHDLHVMKEGPTEDTAAAVIHVAGIAETEIMIEETGMAIEEIEEIEVSIVDAVTGADIMTVAAIEEASVVAEEEADSEVVAIEEDGTEASDIAVVGLRVMLPPADLQEISLSTHQPVPLAEGVHTKINTVVVRTMSLSVVVVVVVVSDHPLDLSLLPQDKSILNGVDMTIDDDTRTEVEVPNEIIIEVMAENGVIVMEMTAGAVIVENTRMEGAGVRKTIAVQNDGGIEKLYKSFGKSGE